MVGCWFGNVKDDSAIWLRFDHQADNLVLLPEEAERQRTDAQQRTEELAARLRKWAEAPPDQL